MSNSISQSYIPQGFANFNDDLLRVYIADESNFRELCIIACVCKKWFKIISDNSLGEQRCKSYGVKVDLKGNSWMSQFRTFLQVPQIIALDVSASMNNHNKNTEIVRKVAALEMIKKIIIRLDESVRYQGIDCIAFDGRISIKHCFNPVDIISFFTQDYNNRRYLEINNKRGYYGTTITKLFTKLHGIYEWNKLKNSNIHCQATIISDFQDPGVKIKFLTENKSHLHIQCIDVGEDNNLGDILKEYNNWVPNEILWQHDNLTVKKRKQDATLSKDYELPLSLEKVDLENWEPVQKKRKIYFS